MPNRKTRKHAENTHYYYYNITRAHRRTDKKKPIAIL